MVIEGGKLYLTSSLYSHLFLTQNVGFQLQYVLIHVFKPVLKTLANLDIMKRLISHLQHPSHRPGDRSLNIA